MEAELGSETLHLFVQIDTADCMRRLSLLVFMKA
jgi:hypothetical protein